MSAPLFALVSYVRGPLGEFVDALRRDLHPQNWWLASHVTVLPPRELRGPVEEAQQILEQGCGEVAPFEVGLGEVETFIPTTPTVFIRVAHRAYRVRELHDRLNIGALEYTEPWPYMPHLTIAKFPDTDAAQRAADICRRRWNEFQGSRLIQVEELSFVREGKDRCSWIDLAPITLGSRLAPAR